eukprot:225041-Amphidinium_carterae.1
MAIVRSAATADILHLCHVSFHICAIVRSGVNQEVSENLYKVIVLTSVVPVDPRRCAHTFHSAVGKRPLDQTFVDIQALRSMHYPCAQ